MIGRNDPLSQEVFGEKNWRYGYPKHFVDNVKESLKSPAAALEIAQRGLDEMYTSFQFIREGKAYGLNDARETFADEYFQTKVIQGNKSLASESALKMPYGGSMLEDAMVLKQIKTWASHGTIGKDVYGAIEQILSTPGSYFDLKDRYFIMLGASSEMGPLENLLDLGADIIAIDLPNRPLVWKRMMDYAQNSAGSLTVPVKPGNVGDSIDEIAANAGTDLLLETPEIITWLTQFTKAKHCTIGSYTYLDSDLFARIAVAGDWIAQSLVEIAPGKHSYMD